jgi:hypothetical protein
MESCTERKLESFELKGKRKEPGDYRNHPACFLQLFRLL